MTKSMWRATVEAAVQKMGHTRGRVICLSQCWPWRGRTHRETPPVTKLAGSISLPLPQHKHMATCRNHCRADTSYLTWLHQGPPPNLSADPPFPVMLASVPALPVPSPRKNDVNLNNTMSPDLYLLWGLSPGCSSWSLPGEDMNTLLKLHLLPTCTFKVSLASPCLHSSCCMSPVEETSTQPVGTVSPPACTLLSDHGYSLK